MLQRCSGVSLSNPHEVLHRRNTPLYICFLPPLTYILNQLLFGNIALS